MSLKNYTLTAAASHVKIYEEKDCDIDKINQLAYFLDNCLWYEYYREDSTTGLRLDEIEDLLVDLQDFVKVSDAVYNADNAIDKYIGSNEGVYIRGDLAFAIPKMDSIVEMLERIAKMLIEKVERNFVYICPPKTEYSTKAGVKAFWTIEE